MTHEKFDKAKEISDSMERLLDINRAFSLPYPKLFVRVKKQIFLWTDNSDSYSISFAGLDNETREGLKKLIKDYIMSRYDELKKEYEAL